jgi:hypothetical protein
MKFNIGDHLQEIGSYAHGIVICFDGMSNDNNWYEIKNDELGLVNHWVPESQLEFHKQTLREDKLKELGI